MFDSHIRPFIDMGLNPLGKILTKYKISANTMTILGLGFGLVAIGLISQQMYTPALLFIILNRLADGLDGAIARHEGLSDFGGFLDIVCDFIIYSGIVFAFGLANEDHLFAAALLVFSFIGPITSFLAYAIIAAKHKVTSSKRGHKSFYYLGGICEGGETAFVLMLICLVPQHFNYICYTYAALCWLTTFGRVYAAWHDFQGKS